VIELAHHQYSDAKQMEPDLTMIIVAVQRQLDPNISPQERNQAQQVPIYSKETNNSLFQYRCIISFFRKKILLVLVFFL
jgi:hypothetical protein